MARILKAPGKRVVPGPVADARQAAAALRGEAAKEAAEVRAAAQRDAATLRADAEREGREQGRAEVAALLVEAVAIRDRALGDADAQIGRLGLAVAGQLLAEELRLAPERLGALVDAVLQPARRARRLTVYVPVGGGAALAERPGLNVVEDPSLALGDVVIETELGRLDGRLKVRLAALERALES